MLLIVSVAAPTLALLLGYTHPGTDPAGAPTPVIPTREVAVYKVNEYNVPKSDVVITVNTFPFDVGGSRPFQISAHGKKYRFKPEDVREFLKKGVQMDIPSEPLPTGTWIGPFPFVGDMPKQIKPVRLNIN